MGMYTCEVIVAGLKYKIWSVQLRDKMQQLKNVLNSLMLCYYDDDGTQLSSGFPPPTVVSHTFPLTTRLFIQ